MTTNKLQSLLLLLALATSATAWKHVPKLAVLPIRGGSSVPRVRGGSWGSSSRTATEVATKKAMGWFAEYATKLFNEADTNKDGILSVPELESAMVHAIINHSDQNRGTAQ